MSNRDETVELDGVVREVLPKSRFIVEITEEGFEGIKLEGYIGGKMRMNSIRVVEGDRLRVQISSSELTNMSFEEDAPLIKGRIVYRYK